MSKKMKNQPKADRPLDESKDLSKKVMQEIHEKQIKMRPKIYFIFGSLSLGIGLAGILITAIFFMNLVFFKVGFQEPLGYLRFGRFGLKPFLQNLPWLPFFIGVGGLVGGLVLLKRFEISYKKSFLGLSLGLIAMVLTLSFILNKANFNRRASQLKPLQRLYQEKLESRDWLIGKVIETNGDELVIMTPQGKRLSLLIQKSTKCPLGRNFKVGSWVRAVGEKKNGIFAVQGVSPVGPGFLKWQNLYFKRGFPSPSPFN